MGIHFFARRAHGSKGLTNLLDLCHAKGHLIEEQHHGLDILIVLGLSQSLQEVLQRSRRDPRKKRQFFAARLFHDRPVEREDGDHSLRALFFALFCVLSRRTRCDEKANRGNYCQALHHPHHDSLSLMKQRFVVTGHSCKKNPAPHSQAP